VDDLILADSAVHLSRTFGVIRRLIPAKRRQGGHVIPPPLLYDFAWQFVIDHRGLSRL